MRQNFCPYRFLSYACGIHNLGTQRAVNFLSHAMILTTPTYCSSPFPILFLLFLLFTLLLTLIFGGLYKSRLRWPSMGLWALACWDCGFESRQGHGCMSLVNVVRCQVEVSTIGRSLFQRSPAACMSLSVIRLKNNPLRQ
jgi:hypothetical protein